MGWWSRKKTVIDAEPKTDTLQPNQPTGEYSMANIQTLGDPYSATRYTISIDPASGGGTSAVTIGNATTSYPVGSYPVFVSGGSAGACIPNGGWLSTGNAGWANVNPYILQSQPVTGQYVYGYGPSVDAYMPLSRSEFTEDEIEQAERIMEELSHA